MEEGWHYQQQPTENNKFSPSEENKKFAAQISQKIPSNIRMVLRNDLVELQGSQLFFHEDSSFFRKQLEVFLKKAGYDLQVLCQA